MKGIMYWYLVGATAAGSVADIRRKSVSVWFLGLTAAGTAALAFFEGGVPLSERAFGLLIGVFFLGISFLSKEAVGRADAVMIGILGTGLGWAMSGAVLGFGLLLLSLVSLVLVVVKKVGRKDRIPFFPFLLAGEMLVAAMIRLK